MPRLFLHGSVIATLIMVPEANASTAQFEGAPVVTLKDARRARALEIKSDPMLRAQYRKNRTTMFIGIGVLGGGAAAIGVTQLVRVLALLSETFTSSGESSWRSPGYTVAFGVGGAMVLTGIPLAIVGGFRNKKLRRPNFAFSPWFGPNTHGARLRLSF